MSEDEKQELINLLKVAVIGGIIIMIILIAK